MSPKLSVLIPTFNRAHWVENAIRSVLSPGLDCEVLVVDNGSTDGTWEVLESVAASDPRVKPTRWFSNNGMEVYPALLEMAEGEYVNFFADDDEMLPGGLERKMAVLDAHPKVGMVFSTVRYMDEGGSDKGEAPWGRLSEEDILGGAEYFDALIQGNFVPFPAAMFRRALSPNGDLLRNPAFGHSKDWQFWLELSRRTEFAYLRQPTVRLRLHEGQTTVIDGVKGGGFVESMLNIVGHWMLEAEPPYIPSARAWEGLVQGMARALVTTHGEDKETCVAGLHRLQALRDALEKRLEARAPGAPLPEAFLHEPDWTGAEWVEVLLSYLEAFAPGDPVGLVLVQDPARSIPSGDALEAVLQVVGSTGRERFPDVVVADEPGELLDILRAYPHIQWVPKGQGSVEGLEGVNGRRFALARQRMAGRSSL